MKFKIHLLKKIISILFISFFLSSAAQNNNTDTIKKKKQFFELSFGHSILFISDSRAINIRNQAAIVVPTSSVLFFAELFPQKRLRVPVFFNLPLEAKQFIINGVLVNERASPTFGAGLELKLFHIKIDSRSKLDFEIGPLASFIADKNNVIRFAPIVAARLRLMRGDNFVMYFGGSYSFGINTMGILYGTGTIF